MWCDRCAPACSTGEAGRIPALTRSRRSTAWTSRNARRTRAHHTRRRGLRCRAPQDNGDATRAPASPGLSRCGSQRREREQMSCLRTWPPPRRKPPHSPWPCPRRHAATARPRPLRWSTTTDPARRPPAGSPAVWMVAPTSPTSASSTAAPQPMSSSDWLPPAWANRRPMTSSTSCRSQPTPTATPTYPPSSAVPPPDRRPRRRSRSWSAAGIRPPSQPAGCR
jgi:hypothetical protein